MSLFSLNKKGTETGTQSSSEGLFSLKSNIASVPVASTPVPIPKNAIDFNKFKGQTISQNDGTGIPATDVRARFVAPIDMINPVFRPGRAVVDTFKSSSQDLGKRFLDLSSSFANTKDTINPDGTMETHSLTTPTSIIDRISKVTSVGLGLVNTLFALPTAALKFGEQLPVVGDIVKVVNDTFGKAGEVGSHIGNMVTDKLPLSDSGKKSARPVLNEIFGLLSQIAIGKVAHDAVKPQLESLASQVKDIIKEDQAKKVQVQSAGDVNKIDIRTPDTNHADYAKSQGYEPYVAQDKLPVIDTGKAAQSELPTIQTEVRPSSKLGSYTIEPLKNDVRVTPDLPSVTEPPKSITPPQPVTIDRPVLPDGTRVTKAANDINQKLVEKGFEQLPPEEQAGYTPQTKVEQIQKVSELMSKDIEAARKMIRGEEAIPSGVQHQVLFNAMEEHAIRNGDAALLRDLAKSPLATKLSEAAQALGAHGYSDNPSSPVTAIREITKAREIKGKSKAKDLSDLKKEIKAVKPKKQTWTEFIKSVQC